VLLWIFSTRRGYMTREKKPCFGNTFSRNSRWPVPPVRRQRHRSDRHGMGDL
jgi:hypothetical protein